MKASHLFLNMTILLTAVALAGCAGNDAVQGEKQGGENTATSNVTFIGDGVLPTRAADSPATRTSITHEYKKGATAYWSTGDKVWVKNTSGEWKQSNEGTFNDKKTRGRFNVSGSFNNGCDVHYTGDNGTGTTVTIAANQAQSAANDFSHAGKSGDCGVGTASGSGDSFTFTLKHKASYLCFLPRTSHYMIKKSKLTKIEVIAKDNIAGVYNFSNGELSNAPTSNGSKTITLTTGGSDGFVVNNEQTDIGKGCYIVIAPGTHTLIVRYWFRNTTHSPKKIENGVVTYNNLEGTVTKYIENMNCEPGKIYDVTANLDLEDLDKNGYYMWDAKSVYWHGFSAWQPTINGGYYERYPQSAIQSPVRWYNTPTNHWAEQSAKDCANVNQMAWLVMRGAPHWDNELWTSMGHLYAGRMWIKRLKTIGDAYGTTPDQMQYKAPDNVDYRFVTSYNDQVINRNISHDPLFKDELSGYFHLAPIGLYLEGKASDFGEGTLYWSKTRTLNFGNNLAYCLGVNKQRISVAYNERKYGLPIFKDFK